MSDGKKSGRKRRWDQDVQEAPPREEEKGELNDQVPSKIDVSEIVAKINASLVSKGVPMKPFIEDEFIRAAPADKQDTSEEGKKATTSSEPSLSEALGIEAIKKEKEVDVTKFTFIATIEVNDTKHRYYLTKPATQEELETKFKVIVKSKGKYYPDRRMATERDPALCLEIAAPSQEVLDEVTTYVAELIEKGPTVPASQPSVAMSSMIIEKAFLDVDFDRISAFSLRGKILGPQGSFLKHIQTQTNCKVHLRGKGSGYVELGSKEEAPEGLHLYIAGFKREEVDQAKELAESLLAHVKSEAEAALTPKYPVYPPAYPAGPQGYGYPPPGSYYYPPPYAPYPPADPNAPGYPPMPPPPAPGYAPMSIPGYPPQMPPPGYPHYPPYPAPYPGPVPAQPYPPPYPPPAQPDRPRNGSQASDEPTSYNNAPPPPTYKNT